MTSFQRGLMFAGMALAITAASAAAQLRRVNDRSDDFTLRAPSAPDQESPAAPRDPWLAPDKLQHFSGSFALAAFIHATTASVTNSRDALRVAIPASVLAGIAKEVYDRRRGGFFSYRDLVADVAGVATAWMILREVH